MKHIKQIKHALHHLKTPDLQTVLPNTALTEARLPLRPRKKWLTVPMAVAMALMLTVGAAAGGAILARINADMIVENIQRLAEVPEGYVGIYSAEDLVQMSRDVQNGTNASQYILMNDIAFTDADFAEGGICEGGWVPVDPVVNEYVLGDLHTDGLPEGYSGGSQHNGTPYIQVHKRYTPITNFNGNGYVIRNLQIRANADEMLETNEYGYGEKWMFVGLFAKTQSTFQIFNLGMEDCSITVDSTDLHSTVHETVYVGALAGTANYVGGCYVKGLTVRILLNAVDDPDCPHCVAEQQDRTEDLEVVVGALVGQVNYVDACYAEDYDIEIICNGDVPIVPHVNGLAGESLAALTSWHSGTVTLSGNALSDTCVRPKTHYNAYEHGDRIPIFMTEEKYGAVLAKVLEVYGEDSHEHKMLRVYYPYFDLSEITYEIQKQQMGAFTEVWNKLVSHHTGDYQTSYDAYYLLMANSSSESEIACLEEMLLALFPSEEEYRTFCNGCNVRIGNICCYELSDNAGLKTADLAGFDFDIVWTLRDGKPRLKIFE